MEESFNPYQVLNISEKASQKDIKGRFFVLSKTFHPDKQSYEYRQESTKYFEEVEEAYKILSMPFRRFIFDHYGLQGIKLYDKNPSKFDDLEDQFKQSIVKVEELEAEQQAESDYHQAKGELKKVKRRIKNNMRFVVTLDQEQEINKRFQREVNIDAGFDAREAVNYYIFPTNSHHANNIRSKVKPHFRMTKYTLNNWISLPDYMECQNLLGVYAGRNIHNATFYGVKHKFRKVFSQFWGLELSTLAQLGDDQQSFTANFGKMINKDYHLAVQTMITSSSTPKVAATVTKKLTEDTKCSFGVSRGEEWGVTTVYTKTPGNGNFKIQNIVDLGFGRVTMMPSVSKKLTKRIQIYSELQAVYNRSNFGFHLSTGVKLKASSISKFRIATDLAVNEISLNLIYDRLGLTIKLPILVSSKLRWKHLLFTLTVNALGAWGLSIFETQKKNSKRRKRKLEKNNALRLQHAIRAHQDRQEELGPRVQLNVQREKMLDGLIVLKAVYGKHENVKHLYRAEIAKDGGALINTIVDPIELLQTAIQETEPIEFSVPKNEISDLRLLLQNQVRSGNLEIDMNKLLASEEFYNPCIDEELAPSLFIKVWLNKVVHTIILKKKEYQSFSKEAESTQRRFPGLLGLGAAFSF